MSWLEIGRQKNTLLGNWSTNQNRVGNRLEKMADVPSLEIGRHLKFWVDDIHAVIGNWSIKKTIKHHWKLDDTNMASWKLSL